MIDALVFSRDRPAQLDLLLRSIGRHASGLYRSISILWTSSGSRFNDGYRRIFGDYEWIHELDFENDVREWLAEAGMFVSFLVDDDVFYRDAPSAEHACRRAPFSLRGGDYDYPFSVDGNVYRRDQVVKLLDGLPFRNPTELEWFADQHRSRLPFRWLRPALPPCLVGMALNRVAPMSGMPHAGVDPEAMNEYFLHGARLAIPYFGSLGLGGRAFTPGSLSGRSFTPGPHWLPTPAYIRHSLWESRWAMSSSR